MKPKSEVKEMAANKMGRPPSDNPRNRRLSIRLTESEYEEIEECSRLSGLSKTDAVMKGIRLVKDQIKKDN